MMIMTFLPLYHQNHISWWTGNKKSEFISRHLTNIFIHNFSIIMIDKEKTWLWIIKIPQVFVMRFPIKISKLVNLILALRQSDCRIPNWVNTKTVHSSSTNHCQITACFRSFLRSPSGPRDRNKNASLWNFRGLYIYKRVISSSFMVPHAHIFIISFIQRHIITCGLHG